MNMPGTFDDIDPRAFRQVLGQFATGVTVVSVRIGDDTHAMTANAFSSVSLDPPLVLFCVGKHARMAQLVQAADAFAVSILSAEQIETSRHFGGSHKSEPEPSVRLSDGPVAPLVVDALAALSCRVEAVHEGGDHWIVIGRVVALHDAQTAVTERPLVFFRSRYCQVVERDLDLSRPHETWSNEAILIYHDEWSAGPSAPLDEPESPW